MQSDFSQNFTFQNAAIRGQWINLELVYQKVVSQQPYPVLLKQLLAEFLLGTALLLGLSKEEGKVSLQFQSDSDLEMVTMQANSNFQLRGLLQWQGAFESPEAIQKALQRGMMVINYFPNHTAQHFQSIVDIKGGSVPLAMKHYFEQSEQRDTEIFIAADENKVVGLLLQRMPSGKSQDEKTYQEIVQLAQTVKPEELLEHTPAKMLSLLFSEHDIKLQLPKAFTFGCNSGDKRFDQALFAMARGEVNELLEEKGEVVVTCDFCGKKTVYHEEDIKRILDEN